MFYHPDMKGIDWEALTKRYHAIARQTRTSHEFNDVSNRMLGELTASHMGVRSATGGFNSTNRQAHGRLGVRTTPVDGGYEVTDLIADAAGTKGDMALRIGDVITEIELEPLAGSRTLEVAMEGRAGEETIVTIRRLVDNVEGVSEDKSLNLLITPGGFRQMRQLAYNDWRNRTAKLVDEMSEGRLGYIHIQGMNQPSLDIFERDLFAAAQGKDGLLIDVRNNGGGWTTDRLLASIMAQPHAYTIPRGAEPEVGHYPRDRLFIQRYNLPINMICNEKSFSNAEIISHAFKQLGRGTLVGQETWGGVISTGAFFLIDGTSVRLPFRGWYVMDGSDMENKGAMPDIVVDQTPEAESANTDEQLKAAVDDLLSRLD
jgi:tricorn protease